jgi:DNA polymerase V
MVIAKKSLFTEKLRSDIFIFMDMFANKICYKIDYVPVKESFLAQDLTPEVFRTHEFTSDALVPIFSMAVQCGLFGIQDDHIESYLSLDQKFIRNKHTSFIFKMEGDSMKPHICAGDFLIVDRSLTNFMNKVVVVDIFDERMCKFLTRESNQIILRSFNPKYKDIVVTEEMDMRVFGVAILCFRDLLSDINSS